MIELRAADGKHTLALMGDDRVAFKTTLAEAFEFAIGDWLLYDGRRYTLNVLPSVKKYSRHRYEYNLSFEGALYDLRRAQYLFWGADDDLARNGMAEFSLVGAPQDFLNLVIVNANRIFGEGTWQAGNCIEGEAREISFGCNYCLEVLHRLAQEFETEFWFEGNVIHLCRKEGTLPYSFAYGKGNALYDIERVMKDADVCTRLYAFGSERNLPFGYRNGSVRLRLPDIQYIEQNTDIYGIAEHTQIFEDVYPHRTGSVTGIDPANPLVFIDAAMPFDLVEKNPADSASVYKYLLAGAKAKVHWQSGNLAGYDFEISGYDHPARRFVMIPINEKFATPDTGNNGAFALPNQVLKPAVGDTYVLVDIALPQSYIDAAEQELLAKAQEYLAKNSVPQTEYRVNCNTIAFTKHNLLLELGASVHITDAPLGIDRQIRITGYERSLRSGIVEYTNVQLSDAPANPVALRKYDQYQTQHQIDGSANLAAIATRRSSLIEERASLIEDITSNYTTEINGGLILSTLMQMRGLEADGSLKTNAGISGLTNEVNPVRLWAGDTFENRNTAPFRVRHDGSLVALNAQLQGGMKTDADGERIEVADGVFTMFDDNDRKIVEINSGKKTIQLGTPDLYWDREVFSGFIELIGEDKYGIALGTIKTRLEKGLSVYKDNSIIFRIQASEQTEYLSVIMSNLPTSSAFLTAGQLWRDGDTLKIKQ